MFSSNKHSAADSLECYQFRIWSWSKVQHYITQTITYFLGITTSCREFYSNPSNSCQDISYWTEWDRQVLLAWWKISYIFWTAAVFCFVSSTFPSIVPHILEKQMPRPVKIEKSPLSKFLIQHVFWIRDLASLWWEEPSEPKPTERSVYDLSLLTVRTKTRLQQDQRQSQQAVATGEVKTSASFSEAL